MKKGGLCCILFGAMCLAMCTHGRGGKENDGERVLASLSAVLLAFPYPRWEVVEQINDPICFIPGDDV